MKRGALRRRARDISVMLVVLVCATVVIWTWDRTPTSAFLPPESHYLKLQSEEKVEKLPTALNTETKDSYSSAIPFVNKGIVQCIYRSSFTHLVSCSKVFYAPCLLYSEFRELRLA
jgi:hypothetical protein